MFEFQSTLFQGNQLLQAIADDALTASGERTRISRTQSPTDPAVLKVQLALLDWRADCLPQFGADGGYGDEVAAAVHRFKAEELGVPENEIIDDVGPQTVQRLDAIRAAAEAPAPTSTVTVVNQYGEPLSGVGITADDGSAETFSNTDEQGQAFLSVGAPSQVTLDGSSILFALGELLDRPAQGIDPGAATVVTPGGAVPLLLAPGEQLDLVVAARVDIDVDLLAPLEGTPRVEGSGAVISSDGRTVRLALQAVGGLTATVMLDPPASASIPVELPPLAPWIPPDGYLVQEGDTESSLGIRFFDDPAAFAELSDHPPVAGETLALPPAAVPGWVAAAAEPLPDPPAPQAWFGVAPDAVLAILYENADPAPLQDLVASLEAPPAAAEDPLDVGAARAEAIAAFLALGAEAGVAEAQPVEPGPEGAGLDELPA